LILFIHDVQVMLISESSGGGVNFRRTIQAETTRTDRIAWLHENDELPEAVIRAMHISFQ